MAALINASTTGLGGLISTGDSSGVLALQTAGNTALTISSTQVVNFVNTPTVAGTPLSAGGSSFPSQTANANTFLKTDGTAVYWSVLPSSLSVFTYSGATVAVSVANGSLPVLRYNGSTTNVTVT